MRFRSARSCLLSGLAGAMIRPSTRFPSSAYTLATSLSTSFSVVVTISKESCARATDSMTSRSLQRRDRQYQELQNR